jgi:hypothetical protein
VLLACVAPKLLPITVMEAPTGPDAADRVVMLGVGRRLNFVLLLAVLLTVTVTLPVVAP